MTTDYLDAEHEAQALLSALPRLRAAAQNLLDALENTAHVSPELRELAAALASLPEQPREECKPSVDTESIEAVCPACGGHQ